MENGVLIYKLIDPRTNAIRYIGWTTKTLKTRLSDHMGDAKRGLKNYRCNWIRNLLSENLYPIIEVVEKTSYESRNEREKYWISYYGRENLVNGTDGGEGVSGLVVSDETRRKLHLSHIGQRAWNKGLSVSSEHLKDFQFKKGFVPHNKGVSPSDIVRSKISKSKLGKSIGKTRKETSSIYLGVVYEKEDKVWISQIRFKGKGYFIGRFVNEEDAATAYDICSLWFSSDNRSLNFVKEEKKYASLLSVNNVKNLKELRKIIKDYIINRRKD